MCFISPKKIFFISIISKLNFCVTVLKKFNYLLNVIYLICWCGFHFYHPRFELWKYKIDSMHATELALLSRDLLLPPHHIHSDWIGWFSWSPWLILLAYDLMFWNMSTKQGALYLSLEDRKICVIRLKTLKPCIILFPRSQLVILLFISISHDTLSYIINFTFLTLFWSYPMSDEETY